MSVQICASFLAADFGHLQAEIDSISTLVDELQADVMDGRFVQNISFGAPVVACIRTTLPIDVHLMVESPVDRLKEFLAIEGVRNITFHAEAVPSTAERRTIITIVKKADRSVGIAINPETPLSAIDDVVDVVDRVLVMTVHPGFSGQEFIESGLEKIRALRRRMPQLQIQVDGGINSRTAALSRAAGATNLVAASAIFAVQHRDEAVRMLRG